ncbi:MAG: DUF4038 domain-containing protein [Lentisphaeria bacterium]|nr:DUF4038 domain-containing protein [Lentisphaeria bacterium]
MYHTGQNQVFEFSLTADRSYDEPFHTIELDVIFTEPSGWERRVPAFWSGDNVWRVRYASPILGRHRFRSVASETGDAGLHGVEGELGIHPYVGKNPLYRHGPLQVSANRRHFEHADGTPFFWLGDTWWLGLCERLEFPGEFQELTADRTGKGFSVIQLVAGLFPDMAAFDERGRNEAGFPWTTDFASIEPAFFDQADLRMNFLVRNGLAPCVLGCWGYYLKWLGIEKMKEHWRYLVARWGALPVIWCLAGEGSMPYYLSETREADSAWLKRGWTEVGRYLREIDPWERPITIHPGTSARETIEDPAILDFDMLQTGHSDRQSLPNTVEQVCRARAIEPTLPVIEGEVCYEGIGAQCREEVQRLMFWACILSGAAGFTYGANGIWQVNRREQPYGPSPHGMAWGHTPWDEAMCLPGSEQLGLARRLLERYAWWDFEPHPEWIEPRWTPENYLHGYAAGIPGRIRVLYWPSQWGKPAVRHLEPNVSYQAFLFNPVNGSEVPLGTAVGDVSGHWELPVSRLPIFQDWVIVLEAE